MMRRVLFLMFVSFTLFICKVHAQHVEYDTNRGFIHPGGLHTQEDFERVKKQLSNGNTKVIQAYNVLKNAEFAQPSIQTYPTEVIERTANGGNYMNAARGATMAYQNALRWKIEGNSDCANAAVRILMQWAKTTKRIGGDANYALASGIYGYQFAQAAELMRDYEGWSREDFREYQDWMRYVWYPTAIEFLRRRNGTWENAAVWWQAPGTYWSNWGLTNALCVISIGILCDDVFIYNQGMSYIKYDQCSTFKDPRTDVPILNDGLAEFLGNFVVTTYDSNLETGAYGKLGQLNESGRDAGHSAMSLGVMLDVAKVAYNQGDDLFSYMDHRLAAGIEYLAAQALSVEGLPWVNYHYCDNQYHYIDNRSWLMTGPAMGAQMRPYWGTVIGIYEGVKGVVMPFAEQAYMKMGIDAGGQGATSGGFDHLGYSVLMNTYDTQLCPIDKTPTELSPLIEYGGNINTDLIPSLTQEQNRNLVVGQEIAHSELGGLVNTYVTNNKTGVPVGTPITLKPQLPEGEEDTGHWLWNTGETTRNIKITANKSYIYRVKYINKNGIASHLAYSIAVQGDCMPTDNFTTTIKSNGTIVGSTEALVQRGTRATFTISDVQYGSWEWYNGAGSSICTTDVLQNDTTFTVTVYNQGGAPYTREIHITVTDDLPRIGLLLYHDFEMTPTEEGLLPDSLDQYYASLSGSAERRLLDDGNHAIYTGTKQGYVDLGKAVGPQVMSQLKNNYTISLDLCVMLSTKLSNYCWAWAFANGTDQYVGLVNKPGNTDWYYEVKDGEAIKNHSNSALKFRQWHTITVVQKGSTNTIYIDGVQKSSTTISLNLVNFGYKLEENWLGRSPFEGDDYLASTYLDNLRIYNTALTENEVKALADKRPTSRTYVSGIDQIENSPKNTDTYIYDLQGRRVTRQPLLKGIYIVNGKKIYVK